MALNRSECGIFKEVTFINEGFLASIGIAALITIGLPMALVTGCVLISKASENINTSKIKHGLTKLGNHKNVKRFADKIKSVKYISIDDLMKKVNIDEDKKQKYKYISVACAVIEDKSGNILAYAVSESKYSDRYAFHIVDKESGKSKELDNYVKATFEFHFGLLGPGIKSITNIKNNNANFKGRYFNNRYKQYKGADLSEEEIKEAHKLADTLIKQLISKVKGAFSSSYYIEAEKYTEDYSDTHFLVNIKIILKDYADNKIKEYNDIYQANHEMEKDLVKKVEPIFKSFGFETKVDADDIIYIEGRNSEKYPYFNLDLTPPMSDDDYEACCYSILVSTKRKL